MGTQGSPVKSYDYLLKFLLVGDSDVGKGEILESLQDGAAESPYAYSNGKPAPGAARRPASAWPRAGAGRGPGSSVLARRGPARPAASLGRRLGLGPPRKKGLALAAPPLQVCTPGCPQRKAVGSGLRASAPCAGGKRALLRGLNVLSTFPDVWPKHGTYASLAPAWASLSVRG